MREVSIERNTNETQIELTLNLDGAGRYQVDTGCGFLNHMLDIVFIRIHAHTGRCIRSTNMVLSCVKPGGPVWKNALFGRHQASFSPFSSFIISSVIAHALSLIAWLTALSIRLASSAIAAA